MNEPRTSILRSYAALAVGVVCLGFSAIFVRWADAPGAVTSFYRMAIAVVAMAWPFYRRAQTRRGLPRRAIGLAVLGGLFFAADLALWTTGVMIRFAVGRSSVTVNGISMRGVSCSAR